MQLGCLCGVEALPGQGNSAHWAAQRWKLFKDCKVFLKRFRIIPTPTTASAAATTAAAASSSHTFPHCSQLSLGSSEVAPLRLALPLCPQ